MKNLRLLEEIVAEHKSVISKEYEERDIGDHPESKHTRRHVWMMRQDVSLIVLLLGTAVTQANTIRRLLWAVVFLLACILFKIG